MNPMDVISIASAGIELLKTAKETFYKGDRLEEAKIILKREAAEGSLTLQEQVKANQDIIEKLIQQVEENKELIQKHNDVLISVEVQFQKAQTQIQKLKITVYAIGCIALVTMALAIYFRLGRYFRFVKIPKHNESPENIR